MEISVIIPTCYPQAYLYECLQSLMVQTLPKECFEILIILNGEKYPYITEIENFVSTKMSDINIEVYYVEVLGVSNARNWGLKKAQGHFISFIDDDDWVSCDYLEYLLNSIDNKSIAVSNVLTFNDGSSAFKEDYLSVSYRKKRFTASDNIYKLRSFLSNSCCKLIPRDIIGNKTFDARFTLGEDSLFMFAISANIAHINLVDVIYYRRIRSTSASHTRKNRLRYMYNASKLLMAYSYIYIGNFKKYNIKLFFSRLLATMRNVFTYGKSDFK